VRTLLLLPLLCLPALFADQVVLKNGDTLTGSIIKKDGDKLTLKSEFLGDVSMPWTAVQSVRSDQPLTVELPGDQKVVGKLQTQGETLQVVVGPNETRSAPLTQVGGVRNPAEQRTWERLQHPGMLELWTGYFDFGLALARGNARADTITTNFNASRVTRHDKTTVFFNQIYGNARVDNQTRGVANALRGGLSYNHDIAGRLFVSGFNTYEHDVFQNLDLRFVAGLGLGYNLIKTPRTTFALIGGMNYQRENFFAGLVRNSAEANFGDDFVHKLNERTNITQAFRFFANVTETGEYRMNFDIGIVSAINKWLGWQVSATDRYVSNPLVGRQRNDLLLSTGLRVNFSK
jgi:putative salt-induced outer membrane protein YdiY